MSIRSRTHVLRIKAYCFLMSIKPIRTVYVKVGAFCVMVGVVYRLIRGVRDRMRMGMTVDQARERAFKEEDARIDKMVADAVERQYLTARALAKIEKEIAEKTP